MAELSKLGRYELRRVLGKGAMGVVYEGFDPTLGRRVAVKTILKSVAFDDATDRAYAERFVKEAKAVGRLNHPNIVQVHDFGVENEVAYLVMEFIQGRELRSFFTAGEKFDSAEGVRIMGELLDALEFAHEAGVIHRDVKPANVMLDAQRRVKLADFGVARVQDGAEQSQAGTMVGTPAFMSPEQISGGKIDRRTDIFSAGTILYQLLTGEQPFKGDGAWTVAKQIMQDDPPRPSSVVQSVSPAFDGIVSKALAKKPKERYASAREFAAALRGTQVSGAPAPAVVMPKPKPRSEPKASDTELEFWRAIQNSTDAAEFEFYLEQFPEGTYAQLARHKIAKLRSSPDAQATVRMAQEERERQEAEEQAKRKAAEESARQEAEEQAKRKAAEESARQEAEEQAKRNAAEERARQEAEEQAKREAEAKAKRDAEESALREALEKTRREAAEKAKRESEEKIRQAQALARLRQQEEAKARAKAAVDEDATVAIGDARPGAALPPSHAERKTSYALPAIGAGVVIVAGIAAYLFLGRSQVPVPVAQIPAPPKMEAAAPQKAELGAADIDKIRKEAEDRVRREYADKSAVEQAKAAKAAADKAVQDKQIALKAAAEKAAQEQQVAMRIAAEKAAADRAAAERLALERAGAEKAARVAAEKAAEDKAAAAKAAEANLAAAKAAERAATAAKVLPATVAASAPAASPREAGLSGRYAFRLMAGAGVHMMCDRNGFEEDIVIPAGGSQIISGRQFSNLQFQSAQDDSVAAKMFDGSNRLGSGEVKLAGRATATGYAGSYEARYPVSAALCVGRWTLVRKGETVAQTAATPAKAPSVSVAAAAPTALPSESTLTGRYVFRVLPGSGIGIYCDRNGFEEDIEIRASGSQNISGRQFSDLQFLSAQEGAVAAKMSDRSNRFGISEATLAGRADAIGYSGTYVLRGSNAIGRCTGRWTLVRKGEAAVETAVTPAKAPPVTVAAAAPAPSTRAGVLPGRYAFRIMAGSGMWADCDHINVQEDIEIPAGSPQGISGKGFANLRFQIAPDGSLAATAQGVRTGTGTGEVKLAGRVNPTGGYAGTYELRWGARICAGQWSLVR